MFPRLIEQKTFGHNLVDGMLINVPAHVPRWPVQDRETRSGPEAVKDQGSRIGCCCYGLCSYGPYSYRLCSYGLCRYGLYSYGQREGVMDVSETDREEGA